MGRKAVVLSLVACGCAGGAAVYSMPAASTELLALPVERPARYTPRVDPIRTAPADIRIDEILASPVIDDPDFGAAVEQWIEYWQHDQALWFPDFLDRMVGLQETIDSALLASDLPASLRYLPLIESGYFPGASSHAQAVGIWQFMAATAEEMGMEVTRLLDERRDPIRSTEAAVAFLAELREGFGSWFLALAAYNAGPTRVRRILREHAPGVAPSDSLFWALRDRFPIETQDFVPKFMGAVLVAGRPTDYGFEPARTSAAFHFDDVTVPDATTLDVVAQAAETTLEEIERLNPQLLRGMTPPDRETALRVPRGQGPTFERNYQRVPPEERVTFVEHRILEGETLSHIATRYGVLVADLTAANPGLRPRYLRIGSTLTVPVAPSARGVASAGS